MAVETADWVGQVLGDGRYEVTAKLGEGGMGRVYRARDRRLGCDVVIKVPRRDLLADAEFAARFHREVGALVRLTHPHIVKVTDLGEHDGLPFAVMQHLAGGNLRDRQPRGPDGQRQPLPPRSLGDWLEGVAGALDFIHRQGTIHRDVKPDNILFDEHGHVYLSDFGIAKALGTKAPVPANPSITVTGATPGTPAYMAPELAAGQPYDGRADQYALAVTVYRLLAGKPPFEGPNPAVILALHMTQKPTPLHEMAPAVPVELSHAVHRALAKDPKERFPDCTSFARAVLAAVDRTGGAKERVTCPQCGKSFILPASAHGKRLRCPVCQVRFEAPAAAVVPPPPPAASDQEKVDTQTGPTGPPFPAFYVAAAAPTARAPAEPRSMAPFIAAGIVLLLVTVATATWLFWQAFLASPGTPVTDTGQKPPEPALAIEAAPDVTVESGQHQSLDVVLAKEGTNDPVEAELEGLPAKVTSEAVTVGPGQKVARFGVSAQPDAAAGDYEVKVKARVGALRAERVFRLRVKEAVAFRLTVPESVVLRPGESRLVEVRINREGWKGPIELRVEGLPEKVVAEPATVAENQDRAAIEFVAAADVKDTSADVRLAASAGPLKRSESFKLVVQNPVGLLVQVASAATLEGGKSLLLDVQVKRRECRGPVDVQAVGLPSGVKAKPLTIPADQDAGKLELTADKEAPDAKRDVRVVAAIDKITGEGRLQLTLMKGEVAGQVRQFEGHTDLVWSVAFSPDGSLVASASGGRFASRQAAPLPGGDNTLRIWDAKTGTEKHVLRHNSPLHAVVFSKDGDDVLAAGADGQLHQWDLKTGKLARRLRGHTDAVMGVAISGNGRLIASAGKDKTVRLWDWRTGQVIQPVLAGHLGPVQSVAFSPDGSQLISGGLDRRLTLWDVKTGRAIRTFEEGHKNGIMGVAFSPDGRRVASASLDNHVRVWNAETGRSRWTSEGHTDWVVGVVFSPDSKRVLSCGYDKTLRLWDTETGDDLGGFRGHTSYVWSVAFAPDGQTAVSGGSDHTVRLWKLPK